LHITYRPLDVLDGSVLCYLFTQFNRSLFVIVVCINDDKDPPGSCQRRLIRAIFDQFRRCETVSKYPLRWPLGLMVRAPDS
jgi:hypothetical protein